MNNTLKTNNTLTYIGSDMSNIDDVMTYWGWENNNQPLEFSIDNVVIKSDNLGTIFYENVQNKKKKEGKNMLEEKSYEKILRLYKQENYENIKNWFVKEVENEVNSKADVKIFKDLLGTFEEELEKLVADNDIFDATCTQNIYKYQISEDYISKIRNKYKEKRSELEEKIRTNIDSVEAILSLSTTNDLEFTLKQLRNFKIIDKNNKVIVEEIKD